MKLYGIANCNTVKKARQWLSENHRDIPFHDFKKDGIERKLIERWLESADWQQLINRKGTTWRQLEETEKEAIVDKESAILLMLKKPSVIKRPVLETKNRVTIGFDEAVFAETIQNENA